MKTILSVVVALVLVGLGGAYYVNQYAGVPSSNFRTTHVKKGDILPTVTATGTLEPEEIVDVGTQVVGRIKDFGLDPSDPEKKRKVDWNTIVHDGTVLAYIDDELYQAQVDQAAASLQHAKADILQWQAKLEQAELDLKRSETLIKVRTIPGSTIPIKGIADADYEASVANEKTAVANVALAKAAIAQAEAALRMAKTNLDYTIIRSPVEGIIIDRRVNIGQTVVASLNTPSLFLLAKDLSKMQVWASVNEADIGHIQVGVPVHFTVDAFPKEVFRGTVLQVRNNAATTQNVVTYTAVIETDNSQNKLRPFSTANLQFEVDARKGVLLVTNSALRWKPKANQISPEYRDAAAAKRGPPPGAAADLGEPKPSKLLKPKTDKSTLWVRDGDFVRPLDVQIGVSDGIVTEIWGDEVVEGLDVVIGESHQKGAAAAEDDTTNPFAPKMFNRKKS